MAKAILEKSQWLSKLSDSLKHDIAELMVPFDAPEGHIFIKEGDPVNSFLIVESGFLSRSKRPAGEGHEGEEPIQIDKIGPGRVSGFLHVAGSADEEVAFATIEAGKGGAKVWVVPGGHFRKLCDENPKHSAEVIKVLALVLRFSTKIVRGVLSKHPSDHHEDLDDKNKKKVLKVLCYDTTSWVKENFEPAVESFNEEDGTDLKVEMDYTQDRLDAKTAKFAAGYDAVCLFVNDTADAETLWILSMCGVKMIAMRCAGFDRVDLTTCKTFGMSVARVPAYSPYAVAEHAIALLMSVNRRITVASARVKMADFTLDSSLLGMDIHGKNVGVMGTGKIGQILCRIINGFGANLLAYDVFESDDVKSMGGKYVSQEEIFKNCDVIFLMMPLLPATKHTINESVLPKLKKGVILINTSRGGLIDTKALEQGLQSGIIGGCGLDVYENEGDYFFQDWSGDAIKDNTLVTLLGSNRVVMTAHMAFFTREAIGKIVSTTIENFSNYSSGLRGKDLPNSL
jgi:D-lactate dehydrogenase